jgi:hypothetical protein
MKFGQLKRISREDLAKASTDLPKWIDAFLDAINPFIEKTGVCLQNGITIEDNMLAKRVRLQFTHDTEHLINPFPTSSKNLSLDGVFFVDSGGLGVDVFRWVKKNDGSIGVTFKFDGGDATTKAWCTLYIFLR